VVPFKHGQQEVAKSLSFFVLNHVLISEDFLDRPEPEVLDPPKVPPAIEVLLGVLARQGQVLGHAPEQFHHLGQVVVIFVVVVAFSGFEKEVARDHLEDCASE